MKLKHYSLWAFALAFAAVSCSDDMDDPNKGDNGNGNKGETTFVKVSVNPGVVTKAQPGEDGDVENGETGDPNEYQVDNVTVILYGDKDGKGFAATTSSNFSSECKLIAAGYATTSGIMGPGDDNWHDKAIIIEVEIAEGAAQNFDDQTYGIIAVTNWGGDDLKNAVVGQNATITTASGLADYLVTSTKYMSGNNTSFVMSSHKPTGETITLKANVTADQAPQANVHVERVAAKVRINPAAAEKATNFIYTLGEANSPKAKVRLDQVSLVNTLTSGSYLLKRVTTDSNDGTIPADGDIWLGDEKATTDNAAGLNYVIDPWTRAKNEAGLDNITGISGTTGANLSYGNAFAGDNYAALWNSLTGGIALSTGADAAATAAITLGYPMENTTSAAMSKNGYSTGALFKATYFPKEWSAVTTKENKEVVAAVAVDYNGDEAGEGFDEINSNEAAANFAGFYVYQGNIYKDQEAIFNEYVWSVQKSLDGTKATIYGYKDFATFGDTFTDDFKSSPLYNANDPFGYLAALKTAIDGNQTLPKIVDYLAAEANAEAVTKNVNFYDKGVCYYPYWIRHADNNKPTEMGIMEFGIVRNNIYDLTVTGINGLGLSGIDKPNPKDDDEKKTYYFNVQINVKNWVVRKNNDIIL